MIFRNVVSRRIRVFVPSTLLFGSVESGAFIRICWLNCYTELLDILIDRFGVHILNALFTAIYDFLGRETNPFISFFIYTIIDPLTIDPILNTGKDWEDMSSIESLIIFNFNSFTWPIWVIIDNFRYLGILFGNCNRLNNFIKFIVLGLRDIGEIIDRLLVLLVDLAIRSDQLMVIFIEIKLLVLLAGLSIVGCKVLKMFCVIFVKC